MKLNAREEISTERKEYERRDKHGERKRKRKRRRHTIFKKQERREERTKGANKVVLSLFPP